MARVRAYRSSATGVMSTAKARVYRSSATGTAVVGPRVRVYRSRSDGPMAITLNPLTAVAGVEPSTPIKITASPAAGSATPSSYVWRQVSGTPVTVAGTGSTLTVVTPAGIDGASAVLGVRGVIGSAQSPEQTVTITALPQIHWFATATGWAPARAQILLTSDDTPPADFVGLGRGPLGTSPLGA